jgi:hypothetical protein
MDFTPGRLAVRYINYSRRLTGAPVLMPAVWGVLLHSTEGHERGDLPILTGATTQNGQPTGVKASVHFYIPQELKNIIAFGDHRPGQAWTLWHAGAGYWQGAAGLNRYLLGVELEHIHGEPYTEAQVASLYALLGYLKTMWAGQAGWKGWLLRHRDVAPTRKTDPTAPFDTAIWPALRTWWAQDQEDDDMPIEQFSATVHEEMKKAQAKLVQDGLLKAGRPIENAAPIGYVDLMLERIREEIKTGKLKAGPGS